MTVLELYYRLGELMGAGQIQPDAVVTLYEHQSDLSGDLVKAYPHPDAPRPNLCLSTDPRGAQI